MVKRGDGGYGRAVHGDHFWFSAISHSRSNPATRPSFVFSGIEGSTTPPSSHGRFRVALTGPPLFDAINWYGYQMSSCLMEMQQGWKQPPIPGDVVGVSTKDRVLRWIRHALGGRNTYSQRNLLRRDGQEMAMKRRARLTGYIESASLVG